jgi:hypothetical protein
MLGGDMAVSTCDPPCEQWLASMGAGAGLLFSLPCPPLPPDHCRAVVWWCGVVFVPPLPSPPRHHTVAVSTHNPPCEQWLAGLGAGAGGCHSVVVW